MLPKLHFVFYSGGLGLMLSQWTQYFTFYSCIRGSENGNIEDACANNTKKGSKLTNTKFKYMA